MQHACHKPRDQGARGRQGEEGVGEVPRVLLRDVYAGMVKRGRGQGDRGPGTQGPGKGSKGGQGSCHVNQAWRRRQEVARGDGHLRRHP